MSSTTFARWSGGALFASGPVGVVDALLTGLLYPGHRATAHQILSVPWMLGAGLYLAAFLLLALGLPALYRQWAAPAGGWGVAGFVLTVLGVVIGGLAVGLIQLTLIPQAQADPHAFPLGSQPDQAATLLFVTIPVLLLAGGALMVGGAGLRNRLSPREATALLLGSGIIALISLVVPAGLENVLDPLWNGFYFLALGWCGRAVVASHTDRVRAADRVAPVAHPHADA
ncbi:MAG TPA: hypothetical protein VFE42_12270 [Chloroflexota bacterium]|nr:hypothetical protein [Chloroflexota bacterium]